MGINLIKPGVEGNTYPESIFGSSGDDYIFPSGGYDFVDGKSGYDRVWVFGKASDFEIVISGPYVGVIDAISKASPTGATLANIEEIAFSDKVVKLDLADVYNDKPGYADSFSGGAGRSTVIYGENRDAYKLTEEGRYWRVSERSGLASDTMEGIERIQFKDVSVALDLKSSASSLAAFDAARLLTTLFSSAFLTDPSSRPVIGQVLKAFEQKTHTGEEIARLAISLELVPSPAPQSLEQFVSSIVGHVLQISAVDAPKDLVGNLSGLIRTNQNPTAPYSAEQFIVLASDFVQLTGLASTGLEFLPA